jgi:hypothetical protein
MQAVMGDVVYDAHRGSGVAKVCRNGHWASVAASGDKTERQQTGA